MIDLFRVARSGWKSSVPVSTGIVDMPGMSPWLRPLQTSAMAALLMSLSLSPAIAQPQTDRLQQASYPSAKADKALMLDIVRVGDTLIAAGDRGYILRSEDHGRQWQQIGTPVSTALTDLHFVDDQYGWATGHGGVVLHTRDGGLNWKVQLDGHQINHMTLRFYQQRYDQAEQQLAEHGDTLDASAREEAEILLEELEFKLDDARISAEEGAGKPLLTVWFRNRSQGWVAGAYGMILKTDDGGQSWQPAMGQVPNPDGFHLNQMGQLEPGVLFMVGEAGTLYRSDNDGQQWQALPSPYEGSFFGFKWLQQHQTILAFGLRGHAYLSADRGNRWQKLAIPGQESIMSARVEGHQLILFGGSGSLWYGDLSADNLVIHRAALPESRPISTGTLSGEEQLILAGLGGLRVINWPSEISSSNSLSHPPSSRPSSHAEPSQATPSVQSSENPS